MNIILLFALTIVQSASLATKACTEVTYDFQDNKQPADIKVDGNVEMNDGAMHLKIKKGDTMSEATKKPMGYGALVKFNTPTSYGTYTVVMKSARVGGIVCAFVLMGDSKDEIDIEFVGKNETQMQSNYYSKGELDYTKGVYTDTGFNVHEAYNEYRLKWSESEISWFINGKMVRTVKKTDDKFPSSIMNMYLSLWDGGSGEVGTRVWAGGEIDWQDKEIVDNAGFMRFSVKSISYKC